MVAKTSGYIERLLRRSRAGSARRTFIALIGRHACDCVEDSLLHLEQHQAAQFAGLPAASTGDGATCSPCSQSCRSNITSGTNDGGRSMEIGVYMRLSTLSRNAAIGTRMTLAPTLDQTEG